MTQRNDTHGNGMFTHYLARLFTLVGESTCHTRQEVP